MRITKNTLSASQKNIKEFSPVMTLITCTVLLMMRPANAESYFNPAFLSADTASVADLSRFEQGEQQPGIYHVDIYVNDNFFATKEMKFLNSTGHMSGGGNSGGLVPCLNKKWLIALGVNTEAINNINKYSSDECLPVNKIIPGSEINYDFYKQKLFLSFPQAWVNNNISGYIPPSEWSNGIPAALLNYNFSADEGSEGKNYFLMLGSGVNLGAWRLRNNSSWAYDEYSGYRSNKWSNIGTYLERAIIPLKSELVIGESSTDNSVYDSVGFRGVRLYSDDSMYPDSQQGFAPTVRGVANSRAKVIIRQNGYIIYQTYVTPGPFIINDLSPTSSSGDLTVNVQESDGSTQTFIVPYSTIPLLQREGRIKFDLVAGNYRSGNEQQDDPFFSQGTIIAGLSNGLTVYGGTQLSSMYHAFTGGAGKNMGDFGAVSLDLTQANSTLPDDSHHTGQSVRFLYAKSLNQLGTTFQLLGYRYSTHGFYTLDDTAYKNNEGYEYGFKDDGYGNQIYTATSYHNLNFSKKGRFQVNINQNLGDFGSMYVSASQQNYWGTSQSNKTYQLGYSNSWHSISYNISWSSTESIGLSDTDHVVAVNLSVPLSSLLGHRYTGSNSIADRMYLTSNVTRNSDGNNTWQTGVSGTLLRGNNLSYSLNQGHSSINDYSGNASAELQGTYGTVSTGYSYAKNSHDYTVQVSGGVVAHQDGITLSQPLGDTNILVKAPGASDVSLENKTGVSTDYRGYTVIPYADAYRMNRVALDTNTMNNNTDITDNVKNVVPTRGAIVRATFDTHIGYQALINLIHDNKPVPFGASVVETKNSVSSITGDAGQVYISGLPPSGKLLVKWGNGVDQRCIANFHLPSINNKIIVYQFTEYCK